MPDGPPVSVLLPARDAAGTLDAALRSLRRQTLTAWECVLVDDGSVDATGTIACAAAARDPRITVVRTPGVGLVRALALGLTRCRGRYVARMDADDLMHRERLALQVAWLDRDTTLAAVGAHVRIVPRRTLTRGLRDYERWLNGIDSPHAVAAEALVECPVAHPTLCARRTVLAEFGYRDVGWPEDYDLVLRLLATGHRIGVVPRRLLCWRDSPTRLTRTHPRYARERLIALKAHALASGLLARTSRYILWGFGATGRALRRALAAEGKRPAFIVELHPRRLGNRIHGAPVVPPAALPALPRAPLVASVAGATARAAIRAHLDGLGWVETRDYVCAA